jgi:protein tyrosine/serine phosphatase
MALKAIVEYWEAAVAANHHHPNNVKLPLIVIHCVQGKDQTGLFSMLCQSIIGIADENIIKVYHLSEQHLAPQFPKVWERMDLVAATTADATLHDTYDDNNPKQFSSKLHNEFWVGAPKHVMVETLAWIRETYGSMNGYMDLIYFDASWQQRFCALTVHGPSRL